MAWAWARGEPITVEELLKQHPELKTEDAVRLVYEDVCLRREAGQDVPTAEVVNRFPQWKDELEVLLDCDRLLRPLSRICPKSVKILVRSASFPSLAGGLQARPIWPPSRRWRTGLSF
jgi:hypothetical protein